MNWILLDLNGTVGTDTPDILEKITNTANIIHRPEVEAHVKVSTLKRIKEISETTNSTVLWISLREDDALLINDIAETDWEYLTMHEPIDRSNVWSKTAPIANFVKEHPNDTVVVVDDMLLVGGALAELKSQAPTVKTVIPLTSKGLTQENLDELASILSKGN